ncbi:MAG: YggS family pyridoxal phosphate-dependent enzyme [Betaproteobacteria bacterium]
MSQLDSPGVRARLEAVRARIARAAARSGREPEQVRLVAVSKTFGAEHVRAAAAAGQVDFGENKVQEALQKQAQTTDLQIRWHLVGHLQSNKARKAGASFDVIHSVDDATLVRKLDEAAAEAERRVDLLVQVDLFGEATKHGATEDSLPSIFEAAAGARAARVAGLMLLPPAVDNPAEARRFFRALRELRERLLARGVDPGMLRELSMGMSHDFEVAIEEGATMVRVGTAIFGSRTVIRSQQ